jgi:hypothetical protein
LPPAPKEDDDGFVQVGKKKTKALALDCEMV